MSDHVHGGPTARDGRAQSTPFTLIGTLFVAGALAGLVLVVTWLWAQPRIDEHIALNLRAAVREVLDAPEQVESWFLYHDTLTKALPAGVDSTGLERAYVGYRADGSRAGIAIVGAQPGFTDEITLIFGYEPSSQQVLGLRVLDQRETPGLGDKIISDSTFLAEFRRATAPLRGVKRGAGKGDPGEIDMITGATVSSRAVIAIVNRRLSQLGRALETVPARRNAP